MATLTRNQLEAKSVEELKVIAQELEITGATVRAKANALDLPLSGGRPSRAVKAVWVSVILDAQAGDDESELVDDYFDEDETPEPLNVNVTQENRVHVSCGASGDFFPVLGKKISEVREGWADILQIGPDSHALLNGDPISDESYRLKVGDRLVFSRPSQGKGA